MIARAFGPALVASWLLVLALIETASAHDGEHAEASAGFQYTEELLGAGGVALMVIGLVVRQLRLRQPRSQS